MTVKIFVYGTLMQGLPNYQVVEDYVLNAEPGIIRGKLYSVSGFFPAAVLNGSESVIIGEWFTIRKEGLKYTDRLEGFRGRGMANHYERVEVIDITGTYSGWVYVYDHTKFMKDSSYPLIESGSWREYTGTEEKQAVLHY